MRAFAATQEVRNKLVEAAPALGWNFAETNLEYSPDPAWITPIMSTMALLAAALDADRISQQFAQ